jgi:23S rRNA (pseudouridine1915-N3)-methyltransferase
VKLKVACIGKTKNPAIRALSDEYLKRISGFTQIEVSEFVDEASLLKATGKSSGRLPPFLVLLDSRDRQFSSEEFADFLRQHQQRATQALIFAIGPADGFTETARRAAGAHISLGKITLAHELARVVLLEQIYRAFTILSGHPYHRGH